MPLQTENVGVAIALVCGAGASTVLGASVVFFPKLVKIVSKRVLASSLGIAAGVMIYVSFLEIFQKSNSSFVEAGKDENTAYQYATLCFFFGIIIMLLLDVIVKRINGKYWHGHELGHKSKVKMSCGHLDAGDKEVMEGSVTMGPICIGCLNDDGLEIEMFKGSGKENSTGFATLHFDDKKKCNACLDDASLETQLEEGTEADVIELNSDHEAIDTDENKKRVQLMQMGLNTALAIALHNFPEGLATFFAALDDPAVGAVTAIAIGIHNIPEGLCVALPIYYATGNRRKAFLWSVMSGISEPIAALLGWLVLTNSFSDTLYAVMFGLVSGMMVIISVKELLPTALGLDPKNTVVTYSFIAGMVIMSLSLVLFTL